MISPFLAAAREKSPSELFPDQAGTKLKPEGEKSDRFARLLHRCEQRPKAPLTENSREDSHFPVQHTAFPVILRGVNGSVAGDAPSMENEGAEAALSGEGPDSLFSGEIPEEEAREHYPLWHKSVKEQELKESRETKDDNPEE